MYVYICVCIYCIYYKENNNLGQVQKCTGINFNVFFSFCLKIFAILANSFEYS